VAKAELVAEGLTFGEGPRWREGRLWLSDFHDHAVKSVGPDGRLRTEIELDDQPSGLGWLPDGRLLVVAMTSRRLLRREPDGRLVTHADLSAVATFHTNDMVVDAQGRAYVGNFGFDLDHALETRGIPDVLAHHATATLARVDPDGRVHEAATELHFPNGTVITPDGRTLILAETLAARLTAFDVAPDGALSRRRVFADIPGCAPDGICLDAEGAIWVANAIAPECVRVREGGEIAERVQTDQPCYACMLGGDDGRTLYALTAATSIAREARAKRSGRVLAARVAVPHAGLP